MNCKRIFLSVLLLRRNTLKKSGGMGEKSPKFPYKIRYFEGRICTAGIVG